MATLTLYLIEWAATLMSFLLIYKCFLTGSTFHRFNRMVLLGILPLSALLPLCRWEILPEVWGTSESELVSYIQLTETVLTGEADIISGDAKAAVQEGVSFTQLIPLMLFIAYLCYLLVMAGNWAHSTWKLQHFIKQCQSHRLGDWVRLVVHNRSYSPFSWMNCIVVSTQEKDYRQNIGFWHEMGHVRNCHFIDLLLVCLCALVNPAAWLLLKELKTVHEYEADEYVLHNMDILPKLYQIQLLKRCVGVEAYALACPLEFNLKKRIIMMKKEKTTPWRKLYLLAALPLASMWMTAFAASSCSDSSDENPLTVTGKAEPISITGSAVSGSFDTISVTGTAEALTEKASFAVHIDNEGNYTYGKWGVSMKAGTLDDIYNYVYSFRDNLTEEEKPYLCINIKVSPQVPTESITKLKDTLRKAWALRITYSTVKE